MQQGWGGGMQAVLLSCLLRFLDHMVAYEIQRGGRRRSSLITRFAPLGGLHSSLCRIVISGAGVRGGGLSPAGEGRAAGREAQSSWRGWPTADDLQEGGGGESSQ